MPPLRLRHVTSVHSVYKAGPPYPRVAWGAAVAEPWYKLCTILVLDSPGRGIASPQPTGDDCAERDLTVLLDSPVPESAACCHHNRKYLDCPPIPPGAAGARQP